MQYLSTASARLFLSSKLSNHNTYSGKKQHKKCEKGGRKVKTVGEPGKKRREKQTNLMQHWLFCQGSHSETLHKFYNKVPTGRHQVARGKR